MGDNTIGVYVTVAALLATLGVSACDDETTPKTKIAPGIVYQSNDVDLGDSSYRVHRTSVDLNKNVGVGVLSNSHVTKTEEPTDMAEDAGAEAVINGDLFDWSFGGTGTQAPVGPVIDSGKPLTSAVSAKAAVGTDRPKIDYPFSAAQTALGITPAGKGTVTGIRGKAVTFGNTSSGGQLELDIPDYNTYKVHRNKIALYDRNWDADLAKVHGKQARFEVRLDNNGVVTGTSKENDPGKINTPELHGNEKILVARGKKAAKELRTLSKGDSLQVMPELASKDEVVNALGGLPLVLDGKTVKGLKADSGMQTVAGVSRDGARLELLVVEGDVVLPDLANYLRKDLGCENAVKFDGGGSSLMGTRDGDDIKVRNKLEKGINVRKMPNALGVFSVDKRLSRLAGGWQPYAGSDGGPSFYIDENKNIEMWSLPELPGRYVGKLALNGSHGTEFIAELKAADTPGGAQPSGPESTTVNLTFDSGAQTLQVDAGGGPMPYTRYFAPW